MSRGRHGVYPIWVCPTCGFGVASRLWGAHRRRCLRLPNEAVCSSCRCPFPCRPKGRKTCPLYEKPREIPDEEPGQAPRSGVVKSLGMSVTRTDDGRWAIRARWLDGPVFGDTWPEAYWAAVRAKEGT